ncbi:restriction endonuclease [Halorubrum sp. 2020YC2]|uniref:restriction endonuclease n=1 Tax=Halorubrum sp. 2020YC2 TaxID=2836432 RepID=UPI001BE80B75|nr:restriction endonuclease [Halorubrum sp. 2020YC2]QWC18982.1 restriction endonuclease [Halorubrum sp. 2020YC2]
MDHSQTEDMEDELLDRMYNMDNEPFKHLCKLILEDVESLSQIEVTQDRSFGPQIRGQVGDQLLAAEFGVHLFRHRSAVPEVAINEISSKFEDTGCQFGTLITLSEFSEDAVTRAEELDGIAVRLINGSDLTSIMIDEEVGVIKGSDGPRLDKSFWAQFDKFNNKLIPSRKVPQADSLQLLTPTLRAIYNEYREFNEMAEYLRKNSSKHITERQAHYYVTAAELVGLVKPILDPHGQSTVHGWELTEDGRQYLKKSDGDDEFVDTKYLEHAIDSLDIVKRIKDNFEEGSGLKHEDLVEIIETETTVTGTTAERRATCLGKWFWTIQGDIKRPDRSKRRYEYYPDGAMDSFFSS